MVANIGKLQRKPKGAERLSFAAIAERLNGEGCTDAHRTSMGARDGARDRPAWAAKLSGKGEEFGTQQTRFARSRANAVPYPRGANGYRGTGR